MKNNSMICHLSFFLFAVLFFSFSGNYLLLAEPPKKILVLPLHLYSDKDIDFLKKGMQEMMLSRLSKEGIVETFNPSNVGISLTKSDKAISEAQALSFGKKAKMDYVVFGTVTIFGDSVSTNSKCLDVASGKSSVVFSRSGNRQGAVIEHVSEFTEAINTKVFGEKVEMKEAFQESKEVIEKKPEDVPQVSEIAPPISFNVQKRVIGPRIGAQVRGLAMGDVDGDGKNEVIVITGHELTVYRIIQNKWKIIARHRESKGFVFIHTNVQDFNDNGTPEIYVTSKKANSNRLHSFVLELKGKKLSKISKGHNYYFNFLDIKGEGLKLYGQKPSRSKDTIDLRAYFEKGFYEFGWKDGKLSVSKKIKLKYQHNVYNTVFGDLTHNNEVFTAYYSEKQKLRVLNSRGKKEWEDTDSFGGTTNYIEVPEPGNKESTLRYYLPVRMIVEDMDGDGKKELILAKNRESFVGVTQTKVLKEGHIECLSWDGLNFVQKWKSDDVKIYISDFVIGDVNHDGKKDLVYSVIQKTRAGYKKGRSTLVVDSIPPASSLGAGLK